MEDNRPDSLLVAERSDCTAGKKGWALDNMAAEVGRGTRELQLGDID